MSLKTSLQVKTFNPVTNKNVTKTATYSNPNATDAQLNSFAQNFYGGLSDNTVNSVVRVDKQDITNAESDTTPEPTFTFEVMPTAAMTFDLDSWQDLKPLVENQTERNRIDNFIANTDQTVTGTTFNIKSGNYEFVIDYQFEEDSEIYTDTQTFKIYDLKINGGIDCPMLEHPDRTTIQGNFYLEDLLELGKTQAEIKSEIKAGNYFKLVALATNASLQKDIAASVTKTPTILLDFYPAHKSLIVTPYSETYTNISMESDLLYKWCVDDNGDLLPAYTSGIMPVGGVINTTEQVVTFTVS